MPKVMEHIRRACGPMPLRPAPGDTKVCPTWATFHLVGPRPSPTTGSGHGLLARPLAALLLPLVALACGTPANSGSTSSTDTADGAGAGDSHATHDAAPAGDAPVDRMVDEPPVPGCSDSDSTASEPTGIAGTLKFKDEKGALISLFDTCKGDGLLIEYDCQHFQGSLTDPTTLASVVFCQCAENVCVDKALKPCEDPKPDQPILGAAIYSWSTDHTVSIGVCVDKTHVNHITCENQVEKQDVTACPDSLPCSYGICGGVHCYDSDPDNNPEKFGHLMVSQTGSGGVGTNDQCLSDGVTTKKVNCPVTSDPAILSDPENFIDLAQTQTTEIPCPDGMVCSPHGQDALCHPPLPPAIDSPCIEDTDPDNDPYQPGSILFQNPAQPPTLDHCDGLTYLDQPDGTVDFHGQLHQYVCEDGAVHTAWGAPDCAAGETCQEGACVSPGPLTCVDQDNGVISKVGRLSMYHADNISPSGLVFFAWDNCNFFGDPTLREYSCVGNVPHWEDVVCPPYSACADGACNPCIDDDEDNDPNFPGTATDYFGAAHSDYCVGDKVRQVYCQPDGTVESAPPAKCPSGICVNGACE